MNCRVIGAVFNPDAREGPGCGPTQGLALTRLGILGVWGFALPVIVTPLTGGPAPILVGVGAPLSSSVLTPDGLRRLLLAGLVFALGPLELVPCWLCCNAMPGAGMWPCEGLPMLGDPGSCRWAAAGDAPMGNWGKLGVRGPGGMLPCGCPLTCPCCAALEIDFTYSPRD